ncbi:MAG: sterol desaturase/sphingolipid hydroxylase (fatty acid hydroxylase superfamily) [Paraglaciecola sp.]|jgi:sterol desaturase/sphingolipid hydroxylase (fatty acid hydroxylase superfamily)
MNQNRKIKKSSIELLFLNKQFNRIIFIALLFIFTACLIFSIYINYQSVVQLDGIPIINWLKNYYWILLHHLSQPFSLATSWLYIGVPLILFVTWLKPAIKQQKIFDKAIAGDFLWMFIHTLTTLGLIYLFFSAVEGYLAPKFNIADFKIMTGAHPALQILMGYLLIELLGWFNHLLRHKIPVLWLFHEVHHSQKNMNPFSLFRVHPVDYLVAEVIILIPAMFFENTLGIILTYLIIARFQDALSHSNIKSNLGPLRYIFVTPQSHRVHHSVETEFFDLNYGVTLCIWDRLFGTHSHTDHAYPETGIKDPDFPLETKYGVFSLPFALFSQLFYPFKKAIKTYWG